MYKFHHYLLPDAFYNYVTPVSSRHEHFTRHSQSNYIIRYSRNNYGRYSPSSYAVLLWSMLENDVKHYPIGLFKKHLHDLFKYLYEE